MSTGHSDAERAFTEWHKSFLLVSPMIEQEHHMAFLAGYAAGEAAQAGRYYSAIMALVEVWEMVTGANESLWTEDLDWRITTLHKLALADATSWDTASKDPEP